jgi:hypothetical protein
MKVIEEGHVYQLQNSDNAETFQTLTFIKRENGALVHDGAQNEEVIAALIDRLIFLDKALSCIENKKALSALQLSLSWLESRTKRRIEQGVEKTDQPHDSGAKVE